MIVKSGIYGIYNRVSGKIYIGSASNLFKRKGNHFMDLRANKHDNSHLQASWNIHGEVAFDFIVLERVSDKTKLIACEQNWLDWYQPFKDRGYNLNHNASSNFGRKFSEVARKNMSEAQKKIPRSPNLLASAIKANTGRKYSAAHCANVSKGLTGRKFSKETKAKQRLSRLAYLAKQRAAQVKIIDLIENQHA